MNNTGNVAATHMFQPDLISPDIPISETKLLAESPQTAFYRVSVFYLPRSGYRIEKASGPSSSKNGIQENFWRPNLRSAMEKKSKLVSSKLNKKKGPRLYVVVSTSGLREDEE